MDHGTWVMKHGSWQHKTWIMQTWKHGNMGHGTFRSARASFSGVRSKHWHASIYKAKKQNV